MQKLQRISVQFHRVRVPAVRKGDGSPLPQPVGEQKRTGPGAEGAMGVGSGRRAAAGSQGAFSVGKSLRANALPLGSRDAEPHVWRDLDPPSQWAVDCCASIFLEVSSVTVTQAWPSMRAGMGTEVFSVHRAGAHQLYR